MVRYYKINQLATCGEAAKILYVHANTLRRWSNNGIITSQRIGSRGDRRFIMEDIIELKCKLQKQNGDPKKVKEFV